jgi:hypothetical protein
MLFGVDVPFVGTPPIRVISRDAKRLQKGGELQKDRILTSPKDLR